MVKKISLRTYLIVLGIGILLLVGLKMLGSYFDYYPNDRKTTVIETSPARNVNSIILYHGEEKKYKLGEKDNAFFKKTVDKFLNKLEEKDPWFRSEEFWNEKTSNMSKNVGNVFVNEDSSLIEGDYIIQFPELDLNAYIGFYYEERRIYSVHLVEDLHYVTRSIYVDIDENGNPISVEVHNTPEFKDWRDAKRCFKKWTKIIWKNHPENSY